MNVYKFGGASVKSAEGVQNLCSIVRNEKESLVVVISAMGKMTNALEAVVNSFFHHKPDLWSNLQVVFDYHDQIVKQLFDDQNQQVTLKIQALYEQLKEILSHKPSLSYDYEYDRIVSFGELLSTTIVAEYLLTQGLSIVFVDIRHCLITDTNYRDANVNLELSAQLCRVAMPEGESTIYLTQGFIAGTETNQTTTLGREGSDYTAALLANMLKANAVTIWKDVPGVMSADPKLYDDVQIIPQLSYKEAIELSYCGASVIHPKTVKPIQNKKIPLLVKSFLQPNEPGSIIHDYPGKLELPPIYINKSNQVLLTLTPRDFSFIAEEKLSKIFGVLASYRLKSSLIQTSAISFSLCIDYNEVNFAKMIEELKEEYEILYNTDVELLTIRHYTKEIVDKLIGERLVFVEQRNRLTARFVIPSHC